MNSPLDKIKPNVRDIAAYTLAPLEAPIKVNQNENPFGMPREIKEEVMRRVMRRDWARYPEFVPASLLKKLAKYAGWREDGVMAGNGSNEMIQSVVNSIVEKGVRVVLPEPTFSVYRQVVTVAGGEIISVPLNEDLTFNFPRLASKIVTSKASLSIVCSPNNPTGCVIGARDLATIARNSDGIVVVDQAYLEIGGEDFLPLLKEYKNLVILRTFSKAMAMGGLRVGYCLAAPELIREFNKAKMPYSLNFFSMTAAEVALENLHLLRPLVEKMQSERDRLFDELRMIKGLEPVPSAANFFCVKTPILPKELFETLHARGILIRDISKAPMLSEYVRISVGAPEENDRLIAALKEIFSYVSSG
ncbi:MAG TPA: histidinol-phosphate transaminase [Blastocatellia bacterium]|nr:histidinol-phosphate transaminase [Blastocatellia bacterium]